MSDSDEPRRREDCSGAEQNSVDDQAADASPDSDDRTRPSLLERRVKAMGEMGRNAAALSARIDEQTKGYREISERFTNAVQPTIDRKRSVDAAIAKMHSPAWTNRPMSNFDRHAELLRSVERPNFGRTYDEMQEQLAAEAAEWEREGERLAAELAEDRRRRDELEAARHDAMLSTLQTMSEAMGSVSVAMDELLNETRQASRLQGGTFLVAVGALLAALVVPVALTSWSALDKWGRTGMLALLVVASSLVTWGLNRRYRG